MDKERRALPLEAAEMRVEDGRVLTGLAAVFDVRSGDLWGFTEEIAPGAFANAIGRSDVRALYNHNPDHVLGRQSAGTLRLRETDRGLEYEVDLPDTTLGRDLPTLINRRDIQGNSFAFSVKRDEWRTEDEQPVRRVLEVAEVYDVGPVTYPAYEATEVSVRSKEVARQMTDPGSPPDVARWIRQLEVDSTD